MGIKYRLGFLFGVIFSLVSGHILHGSKPAIPGLEPLLSLNELAFDTFWILAGLAVGLLFGVFWWAFWKSLHRSSRAIATVNLIQDSLLFQIETNETVLSEPLVLPEPLVYQEAVSKVSIPSQRLS